MTARSRLDVHVHLHGKFADKLPDELHVHLHANSENGGDEVGHDELRRLRARRPPPRMRLGNNIQKPIEAIQTKVRAIDSNPGIICCVGFAMSGGFPPDRIFAKCYHADPGDPTVLPIPLDAVEGLVIDVSGTNYFFDHQSGSQEVPNVLHGLGGGVQNWIVVWPVYGTTVKDITKCSFFGVTATETECEPSGQYAVLREHVRMAAPGPKRYRVRSVGAPNQAPAWQARFTVQHCKKESTPTEIAWTTAAAERGMTDGILWITQGDDSLHATLALRGVMGSKLSAPIVFRCADWKPRGRNTLIPDKGLPLAEKMPKLVVEPE